MSRGPGDDASPRVPAEASSARPPIVVQAARGLAVALALWALWSALGTPTAQLLRVAHVGLALALVFLTFPIARGRAALGVDVALALFALAAPVYVAWDFDAFVYRSARMTDADLLLAGVTVVLALEATRRTTGAMLPALASLALAYAWLGDRLPAPWTHRGYDLRRLLGLEFMGLEGLYGSPIAVSATLIALFTLYGAILQATGAGRFFVDFALALLGRRRAGPARTVTLASFLLGSASGSGVATTVTLGSLTWPLLRRAGYSPERGGAVLAAGGIGAVLSPPVMGAAAFLIAELVGVSYLSVLRWALLPTLLYYASILLMIERDAERQSPVPSDVGQAPDLGSLLRGQGQHFASLVVVVGLLVAGQPPSRAVLWGMAVALLAGAVRPETRLGPGAIVGSLEAGARALLPVAATCATAGLLVGVVNLTGLGLKLSDIILTLAGGSPLVTALCAAALLLVLGLALPITASYIVAAVVIAPALLQVGIAEPAAHMFIFYYAVLSEVSPPTALSCFAVSAITGGNAYRTMWITWAYALPAFVVPFMFAEPSGGMALLLVGSPLEIAIALATAGLGIVALTGALGGGTGWRSGALRRGLLGAAALLLLHPGWPSNLAGLALLAGVRFSSRRP